MSKEMIISVNGREKKIAILNNGKVTEFYIERGSEENSGIVGNIYKGRVQRVLPGMQSAFVDIGLERDAFLYVSDFFDEEEEIERIVMEKGKKISPEEAEREAKEKIERARIEREKQIESAQELAEPLAEIEPEEEIEEEVQPKEKRGRGRRDKRVKEERKFEETKVDEPIEAETSDKETSGEEDTDKDAEESVEFEPLFEMEDFGFERVIDDEETTGDLFKDAYMQEAIVDQVRRVEFDMESTGAAKVGSLIGSVEKEPNGFERIADEDETTEETSKKRASRGRDSKKKAKAETESQAAEGIKAGQDSKKKSSGKAKNTKGKTAKTTTAEEKSAGKTEESAEEKNKKTSNRSKSKKTSSRGKKKNNEGETLENSEASVKETESVAEMTARRGGRGGRRRSGKKHSKQDESGETTQVEESGRSEGDSSGSEYQNRRSGGNGSRRDRSQPTITDLLREGQEILVQIAKEPIAKKGARITSHIALPGRFLVYMPTIEHLGVSRKIESSNERARLRKLIQKIRQEEDIPSGGFIVRTAGTGIEEDELRDDARYLVRTWLDVKKVAEKAKSPAVVHQDLDLIQRLLRDHLSDDFSAIRVDSEEEYLRIVEFINRIQPRMVKRVKFYTREEPILEAFGVQEEIDKALKPRVWLKSGGYLVINQTEALVAIDVNTGKFVGKGNARLEDTITRTNMEAVEEIARQIRLRDLGGIIVLDLIDMEDRRNRHKVMQVLQEQLLTDKSPTKVLSYNDFGLIIMTRKRVKQSLERTLCSPCEYCDGAGWVKSPQTVCYEILEDARRLAKGADDIRQTTLRVHPEVAQALRDSESTVLEEIEAYLGNVDVTGDKSIHQEQFDFAFV
ncbi:MAG TPA: Rne/Rng family ribonuclease [Pyrinomonadaceae bacterium]|nr:Rne/Rng family ribonuclease [Pyrinomonadaceae bacterium]